MTSLLNGKYNPAENTNEELRIPSSKVYWLNKAYVGASVCNFTHRSKSSFAAFSALLPSYLL